MRRSTGSRCYYSMVSGTWDFDSTRGARGARGVSLLDVRSFHCKEKEPEESFDVMRVDRSELRRDTVTVSGDCDPVLSRNKNGCKLPHLAQLAQLVHPAAFREHLLKLLFQHLIAHYAAHESPIP